MLIYDRCKLVSELIVASTWFTLHGVPPRLTQGDWHEISIPYTHHRVFLVLFSPLVISLFVHEKRRGGFPYSQTFRLLQAYSPCLVSTLVSDLPPLTVMTGGLIGQVRGWCFVFCCWREGTLF